VPQAQGPSAPSSAPAGAADHASTPPAEDAAVPVEDVAPAGDAAAAEDADAALAGRLGEAMEVEFVDVALAVASLTHRSYAFERGMTVTNERLEFLGDAVLGVVVTDLAFRAFPDLPEGELAKLRAATVNMFALAEVAAERGLGELVLLGRGEELSGGRAKASILADAMEAVLGAVYLDRGLDVATDLIVRLFRPRMEAYARGEGERDYKTVLQELSAQEVGSVPDYRVAARGPDHQKEFTATVYLAGEPWGSGTGRSKKEAEQQAAREAYERIQAGERPEPPTRKG
jgi:ribonuclease-3